MNGGRGWRGKDMEEKERKEGKREEEGRRKKEGEGKGKERDEGETGGRKRHVEGRETGRQGRKRVGMEWDAKGQGNTSKKRVVWGGSTS